MICNALKLLGTQDNQRRKDWSLTFWQLLSISTGIPDHGAMFLQDVSQTNHCQFVLISIPFLFPFSLFYFILFYFLNITAVFFDVLFGRVLFSRISLYQSDIYQCYTGLTLNQSESNKLHNRFCIYTLLAYQCV